ncbi:MAG: discoidin domain-containing protein [Nitrospirae bacterium]|nr:discoidin domain-containing protein [Nitrospirota bacterium]
MGSLESYATAVLFRLLGPSPALLYAVPCALSVGLIGLVYRLGKSLMGKPDGVLAAAFAALAPVYLVIFGVTPRRGYIETLVFGTVLLLLWRRLAASRGPYREGSALLVLGLVSGIGFWTNFLIAPFIGTVGVLLLVRKPRLVIQPAAGWAVLGFFLGSLPFWIFNFSYEFWSFTLFDFDAGSRPEAWSRAILLLRETAPYILGMRDLSAGGLFWPSTVLLGLGYPALAAGIVWSWLKGGLRRGESGPIEAVMISVVLTAFVLVSYMSSRFGDLGAPRYLFPLYSALPLLVAGGVSFVRRRSPWGWLLIVPILAGNAVGIARAYADIREGKITATAFAGNYMGVNGVRPPDGVEGDLPRLRPLVEFLDGKGIDRVTAAFGISARLNLETAERIVAAVPLEEKNPPPSRLAVERSERAAIVTHGRFTFFEPASFERVLRALGLVFEKAEFDGWRVYYDFKTLGKASSVPIRPTGWRGEASETRDDPRLAFDRDVTTRWGSGKPKGPGIWYLLDLGRIETVHRVVLLPGIFVTDTPVGLRVEASRDKENWRTVWELPEIMPGLYTWRGQPRFDHSGIVELAFPGAQARYLRFTHLGESPPFDWSIGEIFVFSPGAGGMSGKGQTALSRARRDLIFGRRAEAQERLSCILALDRENMKAHQINSALAAGREP